MSLNAAQIAINTAYEASEDGLLSFIVFSLGGELYGVPLLSTREVIRHIKIKPTPYMVDYFKGVINLRGQIIGIVDLRAKFMIEPHAQAENLMIIVESANGPLGAMVDQILGVEKVEKKDIEQTVRLETKIPVDFLIGVAKVKDRLVNMVDIAGCLSSDELRSFKKE